MHIFLSFTTSLGNISAQVGQTYKMTITSFCLR